MTGIMEDIIQSGLESGSAKSAMSASATR